MATFDLTASSTAGVGANSDGTLPAHFGNNPFYQIEAYLDIPKLITAGNSIANGDIFQMLTIPVGTIVFNAGLQIVTPFTASVVGDLDFAAGDDMVDGFDMTSAAGTFGVAGTNGQTNLIITNAASTYLQLVGTEDTIDLKLAGAAAAVGVARVYALLIDCTANGEYPTAAARDILA
jgi:hypothetical protein